MSSLCQITPISAFQNTNLNSHINCFQELGQRILRMLGHPMINVELHPDQLYDAISMATELFSKYAGYTREFLIFDSNLYEHDKGIRLDHLFTVANTQFTLSQKISPPPRATPDFNVSLRENLYICMSALPYSYFISSSALSASVSISGIPMLQVMAEDTYNQFITFDPSLSAVFHLSPKEPFYIQCEEQADAVTYNNIFDYDIMEYRKVIDVIDFDEGSSSSVNTLFSMESIMAQQMFYAGLANFGFDLLSWHAVKDWQKTREKVLATKRDVMFDPRTQYLRMMPQPGPTSHFYGILQCYIERPLRDIIKEKWVLEYATALSKIMWGRILTKISGVTLLGGGSLNGDAILNEGNADKEKLETFLIEGGYGDFEPLMFQMF